MITIVGVSKNGFDGSHRYELESIFGEKVEFINQIGLNGRFSQWKNQEIAAFAFKQGEFDELIKALINATGSERILMFIQKGDSDKAEDGLWVEVINFNYYTKDFDTVIL